MLIAGRLLLEDTAPTEEHVPAEGDAFTGRCRIEPGCIRVTDGHIAEVILGEIPRQADYGGPQCLIAPGLIDTHLHLSQFDAIGAHGLPLLAWLQQVIFPAEQKWADPQFAAGMTQRALQQCLAHGTTAVCAYASVHRDAAAAALETATGMGMRGLIGQVMMDRGAPDDLCFPPRQLIDETARLLDRFPPAGRMAAAVTPRFAVSCSEHLLAEAGRLARERSAAVQTHLAETTAECEVVSNLFGGKSYTDVYADADLLGPRTLLGHGIHLDQAQRRRLAESRSVIVHCPTANSFLRAGAMARQTLLRDGIAISLGSDIGAGYERSMVRVARAMIETASALGQSFPSALQAWHTITAGNADRLGWSDAGRIREGAAADLIVIRPDVPWLEPPIDPAARLLFSWDDRWIRQTFLLGRCVYDAT